MDHSRHDRDLDELIAEITIDCHDDDEQLTAFKDAFDDADLPCPANIVGQEIEILTAGISDNRRELIATCRRDGRTYQVALLDIDLNPADPTTSSLLAAYRRWHGT